MICFLEKGTPNIHTSVFLKRTPSQYMNDQRHINLRANTNLSIVQKDINQLRREMRDSPNQRLDP